VKLACAELSFQDVANGALPSVFSELGTIELAVTDTAAYPNQVAGENALKSFYHSGVEDTAPSLPALDMVICSFALHLIETPSQLFSLLWELSQKARWLVIIAPHKKPDVRTGHYKGPRYLIDCG
jgi:hypothetical protein